MVDSPTTRNRLRKQEVGTNNNTWGTKLNEVLDCVDQVVDGVEAINLGGSASYTLTTSDYTTTDEAKNRVLVCSNLNAAGSSLIVPSVEHVYGVRNSGSTTLTVKTAAGTGVDIPASRFTWVYCDGTNVVSAASTSFPSSYSPGSNTTDAATTGYVDTAIAAASGLTAPFILVTGADTTPGYLTSKVNVTASGAASVAASVTNPGGNEVKTFAISVGSLGLSDGGTISSASAVLVNTKYLCDFTSSSYTITLPAAPTAGDIILLTKYGTNTMTLGLNSLKFNGSTTNPASALEGQTLLRYTGASRGWVEA
jgi:hypothetical protein